MDYFNIFLGWFKITPDIAQAFLIELGIRLLGLFLFIVLSAIIGRYTPSIVRLIIGRVFPQKVAIVYENLIDPLSNSFKIAGTLLLIYWSLVWIAAYERVYSFIEFFMGLAVTISLAWLASRLFRQFVRIYGIELVRKLGREVDELLLIFETLANVIIGFMAVLAFAQGRFDLVGLLAGLGLGGLAIAFAAQKTLEQLLGTMVLYLDRPFVPGDYIRVGLNPHAKPVYGRIESIGLRSTKLRLSATSTLLIVPNSTLANSDIENITRGKKVMVLLYLDFSQMLEEREQALVQQVITESTNSLFGIDPGSTNIALLNSPEQTSTRARVTFFILGSSENSIQLRKRILEVANQKLSKKLMAYGIDFTMQEPTIYVESPVTI